MAKLTSEIVADCSDIFQKASLGIKVLQVLLYRKIKQNKEILQWYYLGFSGSAIKPQQICLYFEYAKFERSLCFSFSLLLLKIVVFGFDLFACQFHYMLLF